MQIGSVTKQFTAAAILRLAERGALTLDDRIEMFVPEFNPRGATIPLRRLLSHTSGVRRDWFPPGSPWPDLTAPVTREQTIKGLNNGQFINFTPGVHVRTPGGALTHPRCARAHPWWHSDTPPVAQ